MLGLFLTAALFAPAQDPVAHVRSDAWEWRFYNGDPSRRYLFDNRGVLQGAYDARTDSYRPLLSREGNIWGDPSEPPVLLPFVFRATHKKPISTGVANYGVDASKLHGASYILNTPKKGGGSESKPISADEAKKVIKDGVPDDSNKLRLTIIGSDAERKQAETDIRADKEIADAVNIWSVPPDHYSVTDNTTGELGFSVSGHPTVYLTKPDGEVIFREDGYKPADIQAIRKKVKDYDPKRDAGLYTSPAVPGPAQLFNHAHTASGLLLLAIGAAVIVLRVRRGNVAA